MAPNDPAPERAALDLDAIILSEGTALADAAAGADAEAPVPGTDWTLGDLVDHVGRLTYFWAGRLRQAGGGDFYDLEPPSDRSRVEWFRDGLAAMRAELAAVADDAQVKTWAGPKPPPWLWRRMAQELAVHRWDAQAAAGNPVLAARGASGAGPLGPAPLDAEVAADGIDEFLDEFVPVGDLSGAVGTLHLHATDGEGEWFLAVTPDGLTWERAHAKGDVALRGTTSDLLLFLWGRLPPDAPEQVTEAGRVEVIGDADVLDRWRAATRF